MWITNGAEAGVFLLFATVDPSLGYRGITAFLIDRDAPGLTVGRKEDKLGIRASSTVTLHLDDCIVPRASVLGEVGKGYTIAIESLNEGRIGIGAQMVGLARGALRHALELRSRTPAVRPRDRRLPGGAVSARAARRRTSRRRA